MHEIAAIWNATASGSSEDRLFRFLLLTGQRREEGALLRYGDFLDGVWHQNRNKTNSPVRFLLSADAMALVGAGEARELVFKGRLEGRPLSGFSKFKKALDELSGVSDWQLRDMRRTMSSFMRNELRIPPHVVNACTNHKPPKIDQTYMVGDMPELKHEAFEAWAKYVTALVTSTEMLAVGS